jgi:hypothetical protein
MASPLATVAATIGKAMSSTFFAATLTRHTAAAIVDPADPAAPTETGYSCRALIDDYSITLKADGVIDAEDRQVLILASTLSVAPIVGDIVTISEGPHDGESFALLWIGTDPARAVWSCRGHPR